jgi:hypothetical protein
MGDSVTTVLFRLRHSLPVRSFLGDQALCFYSFRHRKYGEWKDIYDEPKSMSSFHQITSL